MPVKQREQATNKPVIPGREFADSMARAARIRGAVAPVLAAARATIKKMDQEYEASESKKHQAMYWELKKIITPLDNLVKAADMTFASGFITALESAMAYAGAEAVEAY